MAIRKLTSAGLCCCLLATLAVPTAHADETNWYVAAKASLAQVTLDNTRASNIGTGNMIGGEIDGAISDVDDTDYTAGLGFALGYRWSRWAAEAEYTYRYRTDWDVVAPTPSISTITNVFSNVETHSLVLNLLRHGRLSEKWRWHAGVGVGWVSNKVEAEYLERATATSPEFSTQDDASSSDFTYSVLAGITRPINDRLDLGVRYRYLPLGDLEAGPFNTRPARLSGEHDAHEIQFSLEFTW
ncbi:MAG: outer membrane beta-barrel protein [Pseudomonadota bacterium]